MAGTRKVAGPPGQEKKQLYPVRAANTLGAKMLKGKSQAELDKNPNRYLTSEEIDRDWKPQDKKPK